MKSHSKALNFNNVINEDRNLYAFISEDKAQFARCVLRRDTVDKTTKTNNIRTPDTGSTAEN